MGVAIIPHIFSILRPQLPLMTKILLTLCILFCCNAAIAQDTLMLATGRQLIVNIVSVEARTVKYKRLNDEFGSNYVIDKRKLTAIKYKNGTNDTLTGGDKIPSGGRYAYSHLRISGRKMYLNGTRISRQEFEQELSMVPRAEQEYRYAMTNNTVGIIFALPAGYLLGWQFANAILDKNVSLPLTALGAGLFVTSIVLDNACKNRTLSAVSIYNDHHVKRTVKIDFGLNSSGIGFAMKF
jgi:hypothetical protein